MNNRYYDLNSYLRKTFGCRVQKIAIDAGLSCPNRDGKISRRGCIFCNSRGSGTGAFKNKISITDQILMAKKNLGRRYKAKKFMAYFQSFSNTYATVAKLEKIYDEALSVEDIVGISIGTRPDCINDNILNLIQNYTKEYLVWMEYGLQSVHDKTLNFINRGHNFQCFKKAVEATRQRNIKICTHVILGLPDENKKDMLETAKTISVMGIDGIKIHLLYVVRGTELEKLYLNGEHRCLEMDEYADIVTDFLELIPKNIIVHRLTSKPHKEELIAPLWSLEKNTTHNMIKETLKKRDALQGRLA